MNIQDAHRWGADGYLHLSYESLERLQLDLLLSGALDDADAGAGYCEWAGAHGQPPVSLGWEWTRDACGRPLRVVPGSIMSNVMLTTSGGNDLGAGPTGELLMHWLGRYGWQDAVHRSMALASRSS